MGTSNKKRSISSLRVLQLPRFLYAGDVNDGTLMKGNWWYNEYRMDNEINIPPGSVLGAANVEGSSASLRMFKLAQSPYSVDIEGVTPAIAPPAKSNWSYHWYRIDNEINILPGTVMGLRTSEVRRPHYRWPPRVEGGQLATTYPPVITIPVVGFFFLLGQIAIRVDHQRVLWRGSPYLSMSCRWRRSRHISLIDASGAVFWDRSRWFMCLMEPPSCGTLECDSVLNLVLDSNNIDSAFTFQITAFIYPPWIVGQLLATLFFDRPKIALSLLIDRTVSVHTIIRYLHHMRILQESVKSSQILLSIDNHLLL